MYAPCTDASSRSLARTHVVCARLLVRVGGTCILHALLVRYPHTAYPLVPRVNGSLPRLCSDLLRRSTPLRTTSRFPLSPSVVPSLILRWCPPSSSLSTCTMLRLTRSVRSFVPSFVRVTLAESTPAFRRLQCARQLLFSRPSPSLFPFALPYPPPPATGTPAPPLLSFPRLSFLLPRPNPDAFPRLTGIFGATPFDYR